MPRHTVWLGDRGEPERFDLTYNAADGTRERVVMIHRGTVGAMERVVVVLLERYQGRLPLWLAPIQVRVLPVGPAQEESVRAMLGDLYAAGLRANIEVEGSLGARVRASRQRRDCVIAVLGASEVAAGDVQVIDVAADFKGSVRREELLEGATPLLRHQGAPRRLARKVEQGQWTLRGRTIARQAHPAVPAARSSVALAGYDAASASCSRRCYSTAVRVNSGSPTRSLGFRCCWVGVHCDPAVAAAREKARMRHDYSVVSNTLLSLKRAGQSILSYYPHQYRLACHKRATARVILRGHSILNGTGGPIPEGRLPQPLAVPV